MERGDGLPGAGNGGDEAEPAEQPTQEATIRVYRSDDAPAVRRLMESAFGPVSIAAAMERRWGRAAFPHPWEEVKWRTVAADLERYAPHCFVAVAPAGQVVGCVTSQIAPELSIGRIPDLMVDASYRGQGIGRRLLEHVLAHFRSLGLVAARIETLAHNEVGMHLYPSVGFELIASQHHYAMLLAPPATQEGPPEGAGG